jgi:C4-dicarboxylate-binding protein DctP
LREATPYANDEAAKENDEALAAMVKSGKTNFDYPTEDERKAWQEALRPVRAQMADRVGVDLVRRIEAELARPAP